MEKRENKKQIIILGVVLAISLAVALNIGNIFGGIGTFFKIINPIFLGCMIAVILNVPMEALSRLFEKISGKVKFFKKEKTSLRDYKRMTDDIIKIISVQLRQEATEQNDSETEKENANDGTAEGNIAGTT